MNINPWMQTPPHIDGKSYLCKMKDGYIKMCHYVNGVWLDVWKTTLEGEVKEWTLLPDELINTPISYTKTDDYMDVAEKLYYFINPNSKMDVPNSAYILAEKWFQEWVKTNTDLSLFDWCIKNKTNKNE
jgi:hypothetical protein